MCGNAVYIALTQIALWFVLCIDQVARSEINRVPRIVCVLKLGEREGVQNVRVFCFNY